MLLVRDRQDLSSAPQCRQGPTSNVRRGWVHQAKESSSPWDMLGAYEMEPRTIRCILPLFDEMCLSLWTSEVGDVKYCECKRYIRFVGSESRFRLECECKSYLECLLLKKRYCRETTSIEKEYKIWLWYRTPHSESGICYGWTLANVLPVGGVSFFSHT